MFYKSLKVKLQKYEIVFKKTISYFCSLTLRDL